MNAVYFNSVIDADGDYVFPINHIPAARFEVEGDFDGASVTLGYADSVGAFVAFDAAAYVTDSAKGWNVVNPISGQFAVRVASAGAGTRLIFRYKVAAGGGAVTTESVLTAIGDGSRIDKDYMPLSLEVDYFTCSDRAGLDIPTSSYGQKAGVPFFGNSPLSSVLGHEYAFTSNFFLDTGSSPLGLYSALIASIPMSGADVINGFYIPFEFVATTDSASGGTLPHANDPIYLVFKLGSGALDATYGTWIDLTPTALIEGRSLFGKLLIEVNEGQARVNCAFMLGEKYTSDVVGDPGDFFPYTVPNPEIKASFNVNAEEDTVLQVYLAQNVGQGDFYLGLTNGILRILSFEIILADPALPPS